MSSSGQYRSFLGRARGLGSAKHGTGHWLLQRLTALALIPLVVWFIFSLNALVHSSYEKTAEWFTAPCNAIGTILLLIAVFFHGSLGLRVVLEDYVHSKAVKILGIALVNLLCFAAAVAGIFGVISLYLKG